MTLLTRGSLALHLAALAGVAARPRLWRWAAAAVALDQAVLTGAGMLPRSAWLGPNLVRLPAASGGVALTFDDGPDPAVTPHVLDLLDETGAKASFFCIGARARAHPELVRRIAAAGHAVENHSEHHLYRFAALPPAGLRREIMAAQNILGSLSGRPPRYFRAPMGLRSPLLQAVLEESGLQLAAWTRRALDGRSGDAAAAMRRLTCGLGPGDVLMMHDGNCARDARGRPVVVTVLPLLLDRLQRSAFTGVSLPTSAR